MEVKCLVNTKEKETKIERNETHEIKAKGGCLLIRLTLKSFPSRCTEPTTENLRHNPDVLAHYT